MDFFVLSLGLCSSAQAAAVFIYLFCGWFINNFILSFVILIILLAADFWTVKVGCLLSCKF
jgi:hypothetical protein